MKNGREVLLFGWIIDVAFHWWSHNATQQSRDGFNWRCSGLYCNKANYTIYHSNSMRKLFVRNADCCRVKKFPEFHEMASTMKLKITILWVMINGTLILRAPKTSFDCPIVCATENYRKQTILQWKSRNKVFMMFLFCEICQRRKLGENIKRETWHCLCIRTATLFILARLLFALPQDLDNEPLSS